jgi:hypothetical protein
LNPTVSSHLKENNFSWPVYLESLFVRRMLFVFGLIWIVLREPLLFVHTRFWAEEGTIFYSSAFMNGFLENITALSLGYYTLFNVLISEFAVLLPPESGPLITTLAGFLITLIPVYIIVFTQSLFWDSFYKKLFAILLVITAAPSEIWLNTTCIHCYFGLITFLILLVNYDTASVSQLWFFRIVNGMGVLSGPESMFITPAYVWRAYKERSRESIIQAIITVSFSMIQAGIIIFCILNDNKLGRTQGFSISQFTQTFFCDGFGMMLPVGINDRKIIGIFMALFTVYLIYRRRKNLEIQYISVGFLAVTLFSVLGALGMQSAPRYSYLPTCILILFLLYEVFHFAEMKSGIYMVKVWMLILFFSFTIVYYRSKLVSATEPVKGSPAWKEEVARWRKDKSYMPKIRPVLEGSEFRVKLSE